jgi:hypothetical protein
MGKIACGDFSDNAFVSGRKRRGFCGLRRRVATPGRRFFGQRFRFRPQKAWLLRPAWSRSYARTAIFRTTPSFPAAKGVAFAACLVA